MLRTTATVDTYGPDANGFVPLGDFDRFIPDDVGCTIRALDYRSWVADRPDIDARAFGAKPSGKDIPKKGRQRKRPAA